jgi:hypothetical protein
VFQLVKKVPVLCGNRSLITVSARARQINPVHILTPYSSTTHFNICLPATLFFFSKRFLPFTFSDQRFECISHLSHALNMPRPPRSLDLANLITYGGEETLWSSLIMQISPASCYSFLFGPNIINILNRRSLLMATDRLPYPYTTDKIAV